MVEKNPGHWCKIANYPKSFQIDGYSSCVPLRFACCICGKIQLTIIASGNDIAIDLHCAIFGDEKGSSCIDIEQLRKMHNRLLSKDWLSQNEISYETLYKILRLFGNIEEAINRDGYVVYSSDVEERDIIEVFIQ